MPGADFPVHRVVIKGITVTMHDVFVVTLMGSAVFKGVSSSLVTILTLLDLFWGFLVLCLGLSVGPDFCGSLPTLQA